MLEIENALVAGGYENICGVDEVGRGPLAGPVVTAAVIMPLDELIDGVGDSKKIPAKKREFLAAEIKEKAIAYAICLVDATTIDEINILQATRRCMKESVESLSVAPGFVITDGNMTLDIPFPQRSIVKGDAKSYTIGAASILAKTYRDALMTEYAKTYPGYGFEENVGYGTAKHIEAIKNRGLCPIHRRTFAAKFVK